MIFILVSLIFYPGLTLTVARGEMQYSVRSTRARRIARSVHVRMRMRIVPEVVTAINDKMASV